MFAKQTRMLDVVQLYLGKEDFLRKSFDFDCIPLRGGFDLMDCQDKP